MLKKDGSLDSGMKMSAKGDKQMDTSDEREVHEAIMEEPSMAQHSSKSDSKLGVVSLKQHVARVPGPQRARNIGSQDFKEETSNSLVPKQTNKFRSVGHWPGNRMGRVNNIEQSRLAAKGDSRDKRVTFKVSRSPEGTMLEESSGIPETRLSQAELRLDQPPQPRTKFQRVLAGYRPITQIKAHPKTSENLKATKPRTAHNSTSQAEPVPQHQGYLGIAPKATIKRGLDVGSREVSSFKLSEKHESAYLKHRVLI